MAKFAIYPVVRLFFIIDGRSDLELLACCHSAVLEGVPAARVPPNVAAQFRQILMSKFLMAPFLWFFLGRLLRCCSQIMNRKNYPMVVSIFQSSNEPGEKLMEGSTVCRLTGLKAEV